MAPRPDSCPVDGAHDCPADHPPAATVIRDKRGMPVGDMEVLEQHLGQVLGRLETIAAAALTPADISKAMRDGFVAALHDDATWAAAARGIRESASREAGKVLVGAVGAVFRKAALFTTAGLLVYWIGGWSALVSVWGAMFGSKP